MNISKNNSVSMNVFLHSSLLLFFLGGGLFLTGQFYNWIGVSIVISLTFTATFFIKIINSWHISISQDGKLFLLEFYFKKHNKCLAAPVENISVINLKFYPRFTYFEIMDKTGNVLITDIQINSFELKKLYRLLDEYKIKYNKIYPFG